MIRNVSIIHEGPIVGAIAMREKVVPTPPKRASQGAGAAEQDEKFCDHHFVDACRQLSISGKVDHHCAMLSQTGVVASGILTMKDATSIAVPARSTRNGGDPASFPLGLRPSSLTWPFVQTRTRYSVTAIGIEKYRAPYRVCALRATPPVPGGETFLQ
jgi:hypothetical protein